jgi:DNA-binding LacI/PurR family transcriptional regulator
VAERAGVSRGTVSMVLSGKTSERVPISQETIERVLQAAEQLGYAPNPVAQMLVRGQNNLIGVFTYEPTFPYDQSNVFFPYLSGIQAEAGRQGYNVLLFTDVQAQNENKIYRNSMNSLFLADGSIILGARPDRDELRRLTEEDYPFVYIGRREISGFEINWVVSDYAATSAEAARHLLELRHQRIGFLTDTLDRESEQDKLTGVKQGLGAAGCDPVVLSDVLDLPPAALVRQIRDPRLTALLCANSDVFEHVMRVLHHASIAVPGDVSVVCLIDATPVPPSMLPPTHVQIKRPFIGQTALQMLIGLVEGTVQPPQQILVPGTFVIGDTTGVCRDVSPRR